MQLVFVVVALIVPAFQSGGFLSAAGTADDCAVLIIQETSSATKLVKTKGEAGSPDILGLRFPQFISKPRDFALKLLGICNDHITNKLKKTGSKTAINDEKVDFKNCTFYCKYNINGVHHDNVILPMPLDTPCGPQNQTCAEKDKCVGGVPGC
uniref:Putative ixodes 8-cys protein n=1 Tax=Ixodes ricinus TaxID=34613 RepID=A0A0K8R3B8_IXORI